MRIPKRIHFLWKTEEVPGDMGAYLRRWRELHPSWEITLWTDARMRTFVAGTYPDFLPVYDAYPRNIQRVDSFRYLVLNAIGGVYADLDVEPFRAIDELVDGLDCFAGIEPDEHMGPERRHSGTPFLVTNAFMGGVPGHPWFRQLLELLPRTAANPDVFSSTGPNVTTGAAVRLGREDRPMLVLPQQWSPEGDGGRQYESDMALRRLLGDGFDFAEAEGRFVAHRWVTSWEPWYRRWNWVAKPFHLMNAIKWTYRKWRHRALTKIDIRDPLFPYLDQTPKPPKVWPKVAVSVIAEDGQAVPDALLTALSGLDYPKKKLALRLSAFGDANEKPAALLKAAKASLSGWLGAPGLVVSSPPARNKAGTGLSDTHWHMARWAMLANRAAAEIGDSADWLLFLDSGVTEIPAGALKAMLSCGKPVVALSARDADGAEADRSVFAYHGRTGLRVVYRMRGPDGLAEAGQGQRDYLSSSVAFAEVALDGAGQSCVLVRRDVFEKGVRFAETPYHLHLGGEGLALMARHNGFEAAGLTEWAVTR